MLPAIALALSVLLASAASMAGPQGEPTVVRARIAAPISSVEPGSQFPVAVVLEIEKGWHVWPSEPSLRTVASGAGSFDAAIPTEVRVNAGEDATLGLPQWPAVHFAKADIGEGPKDYPVFEGRAVVFVPVTLAASARGTSIPFKATISYQACNETSCLPPTDVVVSLELPIATGGIASLDESLFDAFDASAFSASGPGGLGAGASPGAAGDGALTIPFFGNEFSVGTEGASFVLLLLVAALGGFLLNLTPCVLPVIPLKVMGLAQSASNRRHALFLATVMSAGVVAFWLALATGLSFIQDFKQANQLFQYPAFTILVGVFIAVMAVGMAGFFSVGLPSWIHSIETKNESATGAFVFGILTAILSTPCTAPLMGAAAGWAVKTESAATIYSVFGAIGCGMASPYLILSAFPQLVARVPRAGEASEVVKQVMGLLLLAAAVYFIGAGINQLLPKPSHAYWWAVSGIGVFAGAWLVRQTIRIAKTAGHRRLFSVVGLAISAMSVAVGVWLGGGERIDWVTYSDEADAEARARGEVVVIDFTADWCINCKTLEKVVLETDLVSGLLDGEGVMPLKADIGRDEAAKARLHAEGYVTIPLLVVVAPNGDVTMKASDYTPQQVADAIARARPAKAPE